MSLKGRKVLLTGATGFIGGYVAKALLSQGADLFCIVRNENRENNFYKSSLNKKTKILFCNLNSLTETKKILVKNNFDYIVHLAGVLRPKNMQEALMGNVASTFNIVEAVKGQKNLKGLVLASSSRAVSSNITEEEIENLWAKPYDFSKTVSDLFISPYLTNKELPVVLLKYPTAFGIGDTYVKPLRLTPQIIENIKTWKEFKVTNNVKVQLAYVEDIAQEFVKVLENINKFKYKTVIVKPLVNTFIQDWINKIARIAKGEVAKNKVDKLLYNTFYN